MIKVYFGEITGEHKGGTLYQGEELLIKKLDHDSALAAKDVRIEELHELKRDILKSNQEHLLCASIDINKLTAQLKAKDETIKGLTECVSFYADKDNWMDDVDGVIITYPDIEEVTNSDGIIKTCGGKLARQVLAALGGK
jgi:hypothetical protein